MGNPVDPSVIIYFYLLVTSLTLLIQFSLFIADAILFMLIGLA